MKPEELLHHEQSMAKASVSVPGSILEDILIPARGYVRARKLEKGNILRVIDVEGEQVPDIILFDANNMKDMSSCFHTTFFQGRWKIGEGDMIYSKFCRPMAKILEYTPSKYERTVGIYFAGGFCNDDLNYARYGIEGMHNCRSNLAASMGSFGLTEGDLELDSVFVPFMHLTYEPDGTFTLQLPDSQAGDYIDIRAERDLIVAISNCPAERSPCNAWNPTALRAVFYRPKG